MIYCFGDCRLDVARRELQRANQVIALEPKVFQVLAYLLERHDRVVSKDELFARCWPEAFVTDAALTRCLSKIRAAIQADRHVPPIIRTVHGQGYRIVAPVSVCETDSVAGAEAATPPPALDMASDAIDSERQPDRETLATILVVDDEAKNVKLLDALLTLRGYRVVTAADGETALRQVQTVQPDLVLLDVMMPVMDGFAVCRQLKDDPQTCLIPVLIMTALDRLEDRVQGIEAGADDFLSKPVHRAELLARVRTALRTKRAIDQRVRSSAQPLYLTIQWQGDRLVIDLAASDAVVPRASIPLDEGILYDISDAYTRIMTPDAHQRQDDEALQRLGGLISGYLFPASIQQQLAAIAPTVLLLRLDDRLLHVPWEWACSGRTYLCDRFRVGRQVMSSQPAPLFRVNRAKQTDTLVLLLIVDPTESVAEALAECESLAARLTRYPRLAVRVMQGRQIRKLELLQALRDSDLVHFIGLTHFDIAQPERSGWQLADTVLTVSEFSRLTNPPLLVLAHADQASGTVRQPPALQVGRGFMLSGIQHYLTPCASWHGVEFASFAADFYHHVLQGASIGNALVAARLQASRTEGLSTPLYTRFIHYGNPALPVSAPS